LFMYCRHHILLCYSFLCLCPSQEINELNDRLGAQTHMNYQVGAVGCPLTFSRKRPRCFIFVQYCPVMIHVLFYSPRASI
jgi:hypothetical protein